MSRPSTREENGRRVERLIEEIEPGHMVALKRSAGRGQWEVFAVGTVSLSEAMKARSINTNAFYLEVDGAPCPACVTTTTRVPATVRYNDTKTAVLNPTDPLEPNTTYRATVESGSGR